MLFLKYSLNLKRKQNPSTSSLLWHGIIHIPTRLISSKSILQSVRHHSLSIWFHSYVMMMIVYIHSTGLAEMKEEKTRYFATITLLNWNIFSTFMMKRLNRTVFYYLSHLPLPPIRTLSSLNCTLHITPSSVGFRIWLPLYLCKLHGTKGLSWVLVFWHKDYMESEEKDGLDRPSSQLCNRGKAFSLHWSWVV